MFIVDAGHQKPATPQIGFKAPSCQQHRGLINFAGSILRGKDRFHFDDAKPGNQMLRAGLCQNPADYVTPGLVMVDLREGTRVEEIMRRSALSALVAYSIGERTLDGRERSPDFIEADIVIRGVRPFVERNY